MGECDFIGEEEIGKVRDIGGQMELELEGREGQAAVGEV